MAVFTVLLSSSLSARQPNFIIILADDLGYGDVGCFGAKLISTPNIDSLAAEGMKLTTFYACANICTPSRAGLLTGRYPIRMNLAQNDIFPGSLVGLPTNEVTLADALKKLGYRSACVGKWHLGERPEFLPTRRGFDEYFGMLHANGFNPTALYRGEKKIESPTDLAKLTERYTEESLKFIEANKDKPFFLYLAHSMPHVPVAASEKFVGHSKAGLYGDAVEEIDWSTGEILKKIKELGLDNDTLVIFTSDNGPSVEGSAGDLSGHKGDYREGGFREPFIARWLGHIGAGGTSAAIASILDFFPTLLELAGGEPPGGVKLDGRSLAGIFGLRTARPEEQQERPIYFFSGGELAAVREGKWKFAAPEEGLHFSYRPGLLFDLETDPAEQFNYSQREPEVMKRMSSLFEQGRKDLVPDTAGMVERLSKTKSAAFTGRFYRSKYFYPFVGICAMVGAFMAGLGIGRRHAKAGK